MECRVYIRKGWDTKAIDCKSIDEAIKFARFGAFLLDIKIKKALSKKDWIKWDNNSCCFEYDITSDKHKDDAFTSVCIRSQAIPISLYGKNIKQIEKNIASKK